MAIAIITATTGTVVAGAIGTTGTNTGNVTTTAGIAAGISIMLMNVATVMAGVTVMIIAVVDATTDAVMVMGTAINPLSGCRALPESA